MASLVFGMMRGEPAVTVEEVQRVAAALGYEQKLTSSLHRPNSEGELQEIIILSPIAAMTQHR